MVHRPSSSIASIGQVLALDAKIGEGEAEVRRKRKKDAAGPRLLRAGRLCHLFLHLRRGHPHTKISGLGKRRRRMARSHLQPEVHASVIQFYFISHGIQVLFVEKE